MSRPCRIIPVERLRDILAYDRDAGVFTWKRRMSARAPAGSIAGGDNRRGFWTICFDGVTYMAHRLAWAYVHGSCDVHLRHINGDSFDNRIANLCLSENTPGLYVPRHGICEDGSHPFERKNAHPDEMDPDEFRRLIADLGLTLTAAARLLHVHRRTAQRWSAGTTPVPHGVAMFLRLSRRSNLKAADVERLTSKSSGLRRPRRSAREIEQTSRRGGHEQSPAAPAPLPATADERAADGGPQDQTSRPA